MFQLFGNSLVASKSLFWNKSLFEQISSPATQREHGPTSSTAAPLFQVQQVIILNDFVSSWFLTRGAVDSLLCEYYVQQWYVPSPVSAPALNLVMQKKDVVCYCDYCPSNSGQGTKEPEMGGWVDKYINYWTKIIYTKSWYWDLKILFAVCCVLCSITRIKNN